ncbi:SET domain-containing protein [Hirsutella rhossiliensis]|uniref:SET domain-containing protein n=1 Tax=Hirsutella rhossiliensis TaxID=111463 RepID=A0A9P8MTT7_9HYPO|nr:SET domain-containing protein [Hirsutella rhossiliensis]KAH0960952.1 SET domain-containing protein [Hirsutella rhossiliensis]
MGSVCVYSSHAFAHGRGISVVTTPDGAQSLRQLPAFAQEGAEFTTHMPPPFEEKMLPGRGRGLVANKTLHRGDRIFALTPILILDEVAHNNLSDKDWIEIQSVAVDRLPPVAKDMMLQLHGEFATDAISGRVDTNSFEVDIGDSAHYIIVPEIARLNHDCRPNADYFFDPQTLTHHVHAATTITPGTEITITYIDLLTPRQERLAQLELSWGFNCTCGSCSMHASLSQESDARLSQMANLTSRLEETPTASSQMAQALISMYEQERLDGFLAGPYRFAALSFCAEGQRWRAIQYARLAIERGMLDYEFRDAHVGLMRQLAEVPEKQPCWPKQPT